MTATRYIRSIFSASWLVMSLVGSYGCAGHQTALKTQTKEDPKLLARRSEDETAHADYERAASNTNDGTRAYQYAWTGHRMWQESGWLAIIVSSKGDALLIGSVPKPVRLTREDIKPFESYVAGTEFPNFPHVEDALCSDGVSAFFEAAVNGQRSSAISNNCGEFGARVVRATRELWRLAEENGGISPLPREVPASPIPIKALDLRTLDAGNPPRADRRS